MEVSTIEGGFHQWGIPNMIHQWLVFYNGKSQKMNEIRIDLGVPPFQETSMSNSARWQDQRSTSLISNI
jgi:hypothetical protein